MARIEVTRVRKHNKGHHQAHKTHHAQKHNVKDGMSTRTKSMIAAAAILLLTLLIIFSPKLFSKQQAKADVVAVINGQDVALSYFQKEYNRVPEAYRAMMTEENFLNQTIVPQVLLLQEADKKGIQTTDQETEDFLNAYLNSSGITKDDLNIQLSQNNMTYEDFFDAYKERLKILKLVNLTVNVPEPSEADIQSFYDQNNASFSVDNGTLSMDEAKDMISYYLKNQKLQEAMKKYLEDLRNNADIKLYPENIKLAAMVQGAESLSATASASSGAGSGSTFMPTNDPVCMEGGKPVIRVYSTTWCPHCNWIEDSVDSVLKDYVGQGKIVAYHWQVDIGDNMLTEEVEKNMPDSEMALFQKYNPGGGVPTYLFGCRYLRIGNGYETQGDLGAEEKEFRSVIDSLVAGSS